MAVNQIIPHLPQGVLKCRGPISYDTYTFTNQKALRLPKDVSPDNEGFEVSEARSSLPVRYNKLTHVVFEEGSIPVSYCYYESHDDRRQVEYHNISIFNSFQFDNAIFEDCDSKWQKLDMKGKGTLHRILLTAFRLWQVLLYDQNKRQWLKRADDPQDKSFSLLLNYGASTGSPDVMSHLSRDLSDEEMEPFYDNYFLHLWTTALNAGMANGLGRMAVYDLLKKLVELLPSVGVNAVVLICNVTSCLRGDDILMSDSASSAFRSPPLKRKRGEGKGDSETETDEGNVESFPKVISRDPDSGLSKYLIMVEIHSRGQSLYQAELKFMKEIISALQAQNAVFGLLFSYDCSILYFAKRLITNEIHFHKCKYQLRLENVDPFNNFNVAAFQTLVMDIFTCLIFGIEKIEA